MIAYVNVRAIGIALVVFAVLYFGFTLFSNVLAREGAHFNAILPWLNIIIYLAWVIAGYLAKGIINGAVVGVGATLLIGVYYMLWSVGLAHAFKENWYMWLLIGVVLSGFGGLMWDIKTKIKARRST